MIPFILKESDIDLVEIISVKRLSKSWVIGLTNVGWISIKSTKDVKEVEAASSSAWMHSIHLLIKVGNTPSNFFKWSSSSIAHKKTIKVLKVSALTYYYE